MSDKKFTLAVLLLFATLTISVVGFNFWVDPLWHYGHAHEYNDVQRVIDEREQKAAQLKYDEKGYSTLLVGSSRGTYIHPTAFEEWDVYNFSAANLSMREYHTFILYAQAKNPNIERVILGVDFFKSSVQEAEAPKSLTNYETKVDQHFYRTKNLFSLDIFKYSIDNFKLSVRDEITEDRLYNRRGEAFAKRLTDEEVVEETRQKIDRFEETFYGENYTYFPQYKEIMEKVKTSMPEGDMIVFTTPISTELFKSLVTTGLHDDYEVWLRDLVDVYGGVWNFMYPNTITNNIYNYYDGHHFYSDVGDLIANRLENGTDSTVPEDFGVYVTAENIDEHLRHVTALVSEL